MPKLWNETIEEHRRAVRDAVLAATAKLVADHGLHEVTMSRIAQESGIGRATLYKYFPDIESILLAWHERQIGAHLQMLVELRDRPGSVEERLEAVLEAYAEIQRRHQGTESAAMLHQGHHVAQARRHLVDLVRGLLEELDRNGGIRRDVPVGELASYCLSSLMAAGSLSSKAAVRRLVQVTLSGLRPDSA